VRKRHWKNRAEEIKLNPNSAPTFATQPNLERMKRGMAPQKFNERTGLWESMELHHTPPQRQGGLFDFVELWPEEHVKLDNFRQLGY
jgi:filamentous hemagglutinin